MVYKILGIIIKTLPFWGFLLWVIISSGGGLRVLLEIVGGILIITFGVSIVALCWWLGNEIYNKG